MCGIAGIINFDNISENDKLKTKTMAEALIHRGPDADGFFADKNIAFAHKRLSIIDISPKANQPMISHDGNVILIFNGEIYNYQEFRPELEKEYKFKTSHSDTETLLYCYKKWGIKGIEKLNGMFACAIYDKNQEKVYLIRDRIGQKPLYYSVINKKIFFSSEIHSFFKASCIKKELNEEAVYHYLTFLTIPAPQTFYKNVQKLEAGHYLEISKSDIKKESYWDISHFLNNPINPSFEDASNQTEALLQKAMLYRFIADVPISLALSGGIDSSLNLHYAHKHHKKISAINLSYEKTSKYDESQAASRYAKDCGVDFYNQKVTLKSFEDDIHELLDIQKDMPFGDINFVLVYTLSKLARKYSTTVMLVGEGGDEIGGYPIYLKLQKDSKWLKHLGFLNKTFPKLMPNKLDIYFHDQLVSRQHIHAFREKEKQCLWKGNKNFNSYQILRKYMDEIRTDVKDSFLRQVLNLEYKLRLPEMILARVDYPSMASSIEARAPFIDYQLIEYSASLPFDLKMKTGTKTILKHIAKEKLPTYLQAIPKIGFGLLLTPFLKYSIPTWIKKEVLHKSSPIHNLLNISYIEKLYNQHIEKRKHGTKLWVIYALHKWMEVNGFK